MELGKVDWSSVLSSLISPRKPDGPCQKLATPGNLAELTGELLSNPGAPAWLQTRSGGGSAPCKEVPFCSEAGEDPRSRPGILLGLFLLEELLLWCWGQGAWGSLIAYFRGWEGACAGRGWWGVGECFSLGLKAVQHVLQQSQNRAVFYYCE